MTANRIKQFFHLINVANFAGKIAMVLLLLSLPFSTSYAKANNNPEKNAKNALTKNAVSKNTKNKSTRQNSIATKSNDKVVSSKYQLSGKKQYRYFAVRGKLIKKQVAAQASAQQNQREGFVKVANEFRNQDDQLYFASASIFVVDQLTGLPLISKNPDQVSPIASISKLMTAMIVLDSNQDLHAPITISQEDVDTLRYSKSRIPVGAMMTRETGILLALMSSENRVANALARHFPGGFPAFIQAMNRKAADLGMSHTSFRDPTGLSNNNVSTARDLSKLVTVASLYPKIREATTMAEAQVSLGGTLAVFSNTNTLVNSPDWSIGVSKTGYIQEAGRCLVMQARVASKPVAIVLLDSSNKSGRQDDAIRIKRLIEGNRS